MLRRNIIFSLILAAGGLLASTSEVLAQPVPNIGGACTSLDSGNTGVCQYNCSGYSIAETPDATCAGASCCVDYGPPAPTVLTFTVPSPCSIPVGASTCSITVVWRVGNPISPSVRHGAIVFSTAASGTASRTLSFGTNFFELTDSGVSLRSAIAQGICATGSTWNGSVCAASSGTGGPGTGTGGPGTGTGGPGPGTGTGGPGPGSGTGSGSSVAGAPVGFLNPLIWNDLPTLLTAVLTSLQSFIVILAIIMIVIGGFMYIMSAGDDGRMTTGKHIVLGALVGLALGIAAPAFLRQIADILGWSAATLPPGVGTSLTLIEIATNVLNFLLSVVGIVALIMLVVGAFMYLTAAGDESRIDTGKSIVKYSIIGITVALVALVLVRQVAGFF